MLLEFLGPFIQKIHILYSIQKSDVWINIHKTQCYIYSCISILVVFINVMKTHLKQIGNIHDIYVCTFTNADF